LQEATERTTWDWLSRLRHQKRAQNAAALGLAVLGPVLAGATYLAMGPLQQGGGSTSLRLVLLADFVYLLLLSGLVLMALMRVVAARRARSAGSKLHLRLTGVFAGVALGPTVLVAVFGVLTINIGLEGWFSDRVRQVVSTSLAAAEAYRDEHRRDLATDAEALAQFLIARRAATTVFHRGRSARSARCRAAADSARSARGFRDRRRR